ncbi:MAG: DNA adenine methylase [Patescibacteria group bacterium]|jgi:DNA adenine methylase
MFYSPLRYPGGKNKLAKFIAQICVDNNINSHYVEPYAGGASVALYLLLEGKVDSITINDYDRSIYAFWYSVLNHTNKLCKMIEDVEINVETWRKAKAIQKTKKYSSLIQLGFSTFFLNRVNMSGIIDGGLIGGIKQDGNYKMDCRFKKQELIKRIREIAKFKKQIQLFNLDAIELIEKIKDESKNQQTIFYFDPPYYLKGPSLYKNSYSSEDHEKVSQEIKKIKTIHWIVSYDNTSKIKNLYKFVKNSFEFNLIYTAFCVKKGKEILFFDSKLKNINFDLITI